MGLLHQPDCWIIIYYYNLLNLYPALLPQGAPRIVQNAAKTFKSLNILKAIAIKNILKPVIVKNILPFDELEVSSNTSNTSNFQ